MADEKANEKMVSEQQEQLTSVVEANQSPSQAARVNKEPTIDADEIRTTDEAKSIKIGEKDEEEDGQNHINNVANNDERKFSVVSFREVCELYEIDLEKGERDRQVIKSKPSALESIRFYIMFLALISPFVTTYSKTIINFAITDMIDPRFIKRQAEHKNPIAANSNATNLPTFDIDNSCPVDELVRKQLIEEDTKDTFRAQTTNGEKFEWDAFNQGLLKAAYSYGHAFFQIPGSRLSEIYGSHRILSVNALFIGACCLAAPFLASISFYLIFVDLMMLGILGSFMTPALITLFSNWLTPGEKSLMISFMLVGSRLGYALSSFLCGQLLQAGISWRYVFYSSGWVGLSFGVIFFLIARSRPIDHPFVSQLELDYLATKNTLVRESLEESKGVKTSVEMGEIREVSSLAENDDNTKGLKKKREGAPWLAIATNIPVWAFVVTKFCVKLACDTAQIELPSYLKRVMHYSAADNGQVNAWNYIIFCASCILVGTSSKFITKKRPLGLSKTAIRKLFQCTASFGVSLVMLGIAFSVCDATATQLFLMIFFFITTFGIGGEAQAPLDLSERYSGTIHAIGSSLAISGAIEPTLVGYLLRGKSSDKDQWKFIWLCASGISLFGGLVFLFFADATIQPFDSISSNDETKKKKSSSQDQVEPETRSEGSDLQQDNSNEADNSTNKQDESIVSKDEPVEIQDETQIHVIQSVDNAKDIQEDEKKQT